MRSQRLGIHLEKCLKWTEFCDANRFDYLVNGVFRCFGCERVELEDESSVAVAIWELVRREKQTGETSVPVDWNLTD